MVSSFSEKPRRSGSLLRAEEEEEEEEEEETKTVSTTSNDRHNPSFRVYYAVTAGSVPFVWESAPGTPKKSASDGFDRRLLTPLPPLTPPPSYYSANTKRSIERSHKKFSLFKAVLPKLLGRKKPTTGPNRLFPSPGSSFSGSSRGGGGGGDDDAEYSGCGDGSPTSTPCAWYAATPGRWWG